MLVLKRAAFAIAVLSLLDASEAFTERLPASLFGVPTRLRANLVARCESLPSGVSPRHTETRRGASKLAMMNREDHSNPLLKRVSHAAASVAVMISLMMPAYIAPERAVAQPAPPTSEQKRQDAASDEGTNRRLPSLGARTVNKDELAPESLKKIQEKAELFGEILADLQDLYVEPVDLDKLAETGFQAMLTSLDPYTEFENVEAAKVMRTQTIGNYGGVGLVISKNKDEQGKDKPYITIANAFEGYAFDAGMRVGDTLVSIDGKDVKDTATNDVSALLKGEPGSKVKLGYTRPGLAEVQTCELIRKVVLLRDVPLGMTLGKDEERIGYVQLKGFSTSAAAELAYVIGQLQSTSPLKTLILDLRGNPGGLLSSAIKVSELFINEGEKIVTTRGRVLSVSAGGGETAAAPSPAAPASSAAAAAAAPATPATPATQVVPSAKDSFKASSTALVKGGVRSTFETTYRSDPIAMRIPNGQQQVVFHPPLLNKETKLVVLVNKYTASAAEIVAGAIQVPILTLRKLQDHDRGIILGETTYGKGLVQQLQRLGQGGQQIKFTIGKYYTPSGRCIQSKTYSATGGGKLGTDETKVADADRKVFYTDSGRKVKDGGGIEPDVVKTLPPAGQLELELERRDLFFEYASVYEAKHLKDGDELARKEELMVSDAVYADFQQWVLAKAQQVESPFDKSLEIMKKALEETGYTAALPEVASLKTKLNVLTRLEFQKDATNIKRRLDSELRRRYVPDSIVTSISLYGDQQVDDAYKLATDAGKFAAVLGNKTPRSSQSASQSNEKIELVSQAQGAWDIFGN